MYGAEGNKVDDRNQQEAESVALLQSHESRRSQTDGKADLRSIIRLEILNLPCKKFSSSVDQQRD